MKNSILHFLLAFAIFAGILLNFSNIFSTSNVATTFGIQISPPENEAYKTSGKIIEQGLPYITNFSFENNRNLQNWSIAKSEDGRMLFANKRGIIAFDGAKETYISIGKIPYVIAKEPISKKIFVTTNDGFGMLKPDPYQDLKYVPLSLGIPKLSVFSKILFTSTLAWFYSDDIIVTTPLDSLEKHEIKYKYDKNEFLGIFKNQDKVFLNVNEKGLYEISGNIPKLVSETNLLSGKQIIFSVQKSVDEVIIGCAGGSLFLMQGENISEYTIEAQKYISESIIAGGTNLNNQQFSINTLSGGAVIINKTDGKTVQTINYRTGLPDDEIYAANVDDQGGFWLSHEYGISRIDMTLPVQNFSNFPGIIGNVTSVVVADSVLYVATTEGVFFLTELRDYKEIEVIRKKKNNFARNNENNSNNSYANETSKIENTSYTDEPDGASDDQYKVIIKKTVKQRWNKFWKKRKNKKKEENTENDNETNEANETNETNETTNTDNNSVKKVVKTNTKKKTKVYGPVNDNPNSKKIYELQSVKNIFKKVEGFEGKCRQILTTQNGILASSNLGLYYITNNKAKLIIQDAYIYRISESENGNYYATSNKGIFKITNLQTDNAESSEFLPQLTESLEIYSFYQEKDNVYWAGSNSLVYKISGDNKKELKVYPLPQEIPEQVTVRKLNGKTLFFLTEKVFEYDPKRDTIILNQQLSAKANMNTSFIFPQQNVNLVTGKDFYENLDTTALETQNSKYIHLFSRIRSSYKDKFNNLWVITTKGEIFKIFTSAAYRETKDNFSLQLIDIIGAKGDTLKLKNQEINLPPDNEGLKIKLLAPYFLKQNAVTYFYELSGTQNVGKKKFNTSILEIPNLAPGKYLLSITAKNSQGQYSNSLNLNIIVKPPYYQTTWFWATVSLVFILSALILFALFFRRREIKMKKQNDFLEQQIRERTKEIREQYDEITLKNEKINQQNTAILLKSEQISEQNHQIVKQNEEITASIRYASRIQRAVLPYTDIFDKYISEYFIIFKPRDVVSGDFYWVHGIENKLYVTAADCTGHGVPGGFLSMLGISFLNEIIISARASNQVLNTSDILDKLKTKVITSLRQDGSRDSTKDGMDLAMVVIDIKEMTLDFSGANNPLLIVRDGSLTEIKADRMPIGFHRRRTEPFTSHIVNLKKGDCIYLFSDGILDQFDSSNPPRRFMRKRFKNLVTQLFGQSMSSQKEVIEDVFDRWRGQNNQVDDVLIMGIKI